jgi:hypothetical protein
MGSALSTAIEDLDADLAAAGEDCILRRVVATVNVDVTVRAVVRPFAPDELVGTIVQTDSHVILSPTQIADALWPDGLPFTPGPFTVDPHVPKAGDKIAIQGKLRNVSFAKPILENGTLVRLELTVAG